MTDLTQDVIQYNWMRSKLKVPTCSKRFIALEKSILYRCQVLVYQVPAETHLLDRELCAEFLLVFMPYILTLVRNFTDRGIPFEAYLRKIIRIRARTFFSERNRQRVKDRAIMYCCGPDIAGVVAPTLSPCYNRAGNLNQEGVSVHYPVKEEQERWRFYSRYRELHTASATQHSSSSFPTPAVASSGLTMENAPAYDSAARERLAQNDVDIATLFRKLHSRPRSSMHLAHPPSDIDTTVPASNRGDVSKRCQAEILLQLENPAAAKLQQQLKRPVQRRRLLTLILSKPEQMTPALINHVAAIMDIDEFELAQLIRQVNETTLAKRNQQSEMQRIINTHWKRRIWLDQQLSTLKSNSYYDKVQEHKLNSERDKVMQMIVERRRERSSCRQGLTFMQLSNLLRLPKGTICSGIFYAREMLRACLQNDPGETDHIADDRQTGYPH